MKLKSFILATFFSVISFAANAQEQVDQNSEDQPVQQIDMRASAQINSLKLRTVMTFSQKLKNIKETAEYLLEPINYKLVLSPISGEQSKRILARPLIRAHSDGSLKTIEDALLQISGEDTILIVDHEHKLITFEFIEPRKSN